MSEEMAVEVDIETECWSTVIEKFQWELGETLESIATRSGHGDRIGRQVRISGELVVEDIGPGREERRRRQAEQDRQAAIDRHALAEGADR